MRRSLMCLLALCAGMSACKEAQPPQGAAIDAAQPSTPDAALDCGAFVMKTAYYEDSDGDGFGVEGEGTRYGCEHDAPAGYSLLWFDCDDNAATLNRERFVDADGDGYGVEGRTACVAEDAEGHAPIAGDCDDSDATRAPSAIEIFFDNVDQNCDSEDNPTGCVVLEESDLSTFVEFDPEVLPGLEDVEIEVDARCADADLFFLVIGACPWCIGYSSVMVVGNRGATAARARVETGFASRELEPIPAGGLSAPFRMELGSPPDPVELIILDGVRDCDESDNVHDLGLGAVECHVP